MHVSKPNLSSSNVTGKSVRIFKAKGIAEMHRFHCMLAHIGYQKTCWPKVLESKQKIPVVKYQRKSVFIDKKDNSLTFKNEDRYICQSISIPVENHIF